MTTTPEEQPLPPEQSEREQAEAEQTAPEQAGQAEAEPQHAEPAQPVPPAAEPEAAADAPTVDANPEPEPFSGGPPALPQPMLVLDGQLPEPVAPAEETVDHGTCRCGGAFDEDGWCTRCGEPRPDPRHHFTAQPHPLVAGVCDRGLRHTDNEDAMALWASADGGSPLHAAVVVCDGVTTATRSAEASLAASEAAVAVLAGADGTPRERLGRATDAAAEAVARIAEAHPDAAPSCTFVAAVIQGDLATIGSVGDSRAYWLPDAGEPVRLSVDDSMAEEQVAAGIERAVAESGPLAHTITRWLGVDAPEHAPHLAEQEVTAPGWLLLCSDGLWNYASDPHDLAAVVHAEEQRLGDEVSPAALAQGLVTWANGLGGADNITVGLVRTGSTTSSTTAPEGQDESHG